MIFTGTRRAAVLAALMPAAFFLLSGCIFAPTLDSISKVGLTSSDRERLLPITVKKFNDARYWGRLDEAMAYVNEAQYESLKPGIKREKKEDKVVENKIDDVEFSDDSWSADVEVITKYYRVPFLVVKERTEKQKWKFAFGKDWELVSLDIPKE